MEVLCNKNRHLLLEAVIYTLYHAPERKKFSCKRHVKLQKTNSLKGPQPLLRALKAPVVFGLVGRLIKEARFNPQIRAAEVFFLSKDNFFFFFFLHLKS